MVNWAQLRLQDLAIVVSEHLHSRQIEVILVGGACVTIYSANQYISGDLDFITYDDMRRVKEALHEIGFERHKHRYFTRPDCPFFIEFVSPPIAIGNEPVRRFQTLETKQGTLRFLTPVDCVKDRLSAYFHWNDTESLEQAILVARQQRLSLRGIRDWAVREGQREKFEVFRDKLKH